ncbi:MAG: fibronectin type III domain-containing protein [Steroidobacteraceae bacterium]
MCRSNLAWAGQALMRVLAATSVAAALSVVSTGAAASTLTISGTPSPSVLAGSSYSFQPGVQGSSSVSFSVHNMPAWATFSTATGRLSGTPSSAAEGTYSGIVITASAGTSTASLASFSIKVVPGKPTISGTPTTAVTAGSAYSFTPHASASSGTVYFSIVNRPSWATFSETTGTLAGTPTTGEAGTFSNIVISAYSYDKSANLSSPNVSLAAFSITVQAGSDAATLHWTIPTENTNGTTLTNLAGFRINYGTAADELSQSVTVANPASSSYVLSDLAAGTWYFAVEAYNTAGVYGPASNVGSVTIQ